jgi:hypothetical protein
VLGVKGPLRRGKLRRALDSSAPFCRPKLACFWFPAEPPVANGWVSPDVLGLDVGITLLSAENLRTGNVWKWFMRNPEIPRAMKLAGLM